MNDFTKNPEFARQQTYFLRTGECKHDEQFRYTTVPYGTKTQITNCGVCGKEFERCYL